MTSVRIVQVISFSCSLAILLGLALGLGFGNILWNPISWIFGGPLLLFLSSFFYLVYCAVCHLWFPKMEPGYPFKSTHGQTFRYSQYGNPHDRTQYFDEEYEDEFEEELFEDILDDDIFENDDEPSQTWEEYKHRFEQDEDENYAKYYLLLGLKQSATKAEVRQRFRELVLKYHPDKIETTRIVLPAGQATKKFTKIIEAYKKIIESMKIERSTP